MQIHHCTVQLYGFQGGIIDIELTAPYPKKTSQAQVHVCGMKLPFLWQMSRLSPLRLNPLGQVKWTWAPIFRPSIRLSSSTSEMSNSGHSMSGKNKNKCFVYEFWFEVYVVLYVYVIVVLSDWREERQFFWEEKNLLRVDLFHGKHV